MAGSLCGVGVLNCLRPGLSAPKSQTHKGYSHLLLLLRRAMLGVVQAVVTTGLVLLWQAHSREKLSRLHRRLCCQQAWFKRRWPCKGSACCHSMHMGKGACCMLAPPTCSHGVLVPPDDVGDDLRLVLDVTLTD